MVDTRDLKSLGQKCPCGFDSRPSHKEGGEGLAKTSSSLFCLPQAGIAPDWFDLLPTVASFASLRSRPESDGRSCKILLFYFKKVIIFVKE